MAKYSQETLVQKLKSLLDTQESITVTSHWIQFHKKHSSSICNIWLQTFFSSPNKIALLHLANDVCQGSKNILPKVFPLLKSHSAKVLRLLKVWKDRDIFDADFIHKLETILTTDDQSTNEIHSQAPVGVDTLDYTPNMQDSVQNTLKNTPEDDVTIQDSNPFLNTLNTSLNSLTHAIRLLKHISTSRISLHNTLMSAPSQHLIHTLSQACINEINQYNCIKDTCNSLFGLVEGLQKDVSSVLVSLEGAGVSDSINVFKAKDSSKEIENSKGISPKEIKLVETLNDAKLVEKLPGSESHEIVSSKEIKLDSDNSSQFKSLPDFIPPSTDIQALLADAVSLIKSGAEGSEAVYSVLADMGVDVDEIIGSKRGSQEANWEEFDNVDEFIKKARR